MKKKLLILVDGSYYLFRAYHALPALRNAQGEETGAIYGVINMLRRLLNDYQPDHFAVVFDPKGKTFRNDIYPEYKAHRPDMPEELAVQIEPLHTLIKAMGFPLLMIDKVEADDVIGTLSVQAEAEGMDVLISSGDKDLAQLVNDNIKMINTMKNVVIDRKGVMEKYGVTPEQIIDYLTLVGDSVDNVPGVPKVGPKTAAKWLTEYGNLDNIIKNAADIKGKVGEYLRDSIDSLPLSKQLVTLKCDVPLDFSPDDLRCGEADKPKLTEEYRRWGFKSLLKEINPPDDEKQNSKQTPTQQPQGNSCEYETVFTASELDRWIEKLEEADLFAFDTETTSLNYSEAEIVGLSFAVDELKAAYVPLAHDYDNAPKQLDRDATLKKLKPLLESNKHQKLGHHLKYDMNVLTNHGIHLQGCQHDSMLESYVLNSTASRHDMDSLALKYLERQTIHFEDVAGKGSKQLTFNKVDIETAAPYAAEDAEVTLLLHQYLWPKLEKIPELRQVYEDIEIPLMPVLSRMECRGVLIDRQLLAKQGKELRLRLKDIEQEVYEQAGRQFNIGSPKQIQEILYEDLDLPVLAKTPKGQPSTAESVLQELAMEYELPHLILEYRSLSKLISTYIDRLPEQISQKTGRVHTSYHQAVAATGRLSSSDPNLQNIPIRSEEGRRIRKAFVAPDGMVLLAADYSQIELRIMAHLSGDEGLLSAFENGEDIHKMTAAEVFDVAPSKVSKEQRRSAKAINFGLIYGMSPFGLAKQLGIDRGEAKQYVERYFERYPGVKEYMEQTRKRARKVGHVETVFGRRLYLPDINAKNAARRQYAERTAINAPMQGTAADIIKRAMISVHQWLMDEDPGAELIMQVHDELVFEVKEKQVKKVSEKVRELMIGAADLKVHLEVDIGNGKNWEEAH